ncbi:hypothetical protein [Amycolatopsis minnesotensis]|uniref:Uncharacterized protein n=1 Tax=Amycolatopsis minnesotensis TaxID=337894 RepID=A0ABN2RMM9_9PSEU
MSEYQYYEFLAVDEPLDDQQQAELRELSTRADITATKFVNEYHFGSFRGNPATMVERYFDAFLYTANWRTHQLMLRIPERLLDLAVAERYCCGDDVSVRRHGDNLILDLRSEIEEGEWTESDETRLGELIPIRADLAGGDHRALYLVWLLAAETDLDLDELEPPVPPGLATLNGPLRTLAEFLRIDENLLAVAAQASGQADEVDADLAAFVKALPQKDKDALLVRTVTGDPHVAAEVKQLFRRQHTDAPETGTRTVGDLLDAAETRQAERQRQAARLAAEERERRKRAQAAARERRLDEVAAAGDDAWRQVDSLIETKRPDNYDAAVALLSDLKSVSARTGEQQKFAKRYEQLRDAHRRKPSLQERFTRAGL